MNNFFNIFEASISQNTVRLLASNHSNHCSKYSSPQNLYIQRPSYNNPSVSNRLSDCALVLFFLYTLKYNLVIFYFPKESQFQIKITPNLFVCRGNVLEKFNKISNKMCKLLAQQKMQQKRAQHS